VNPNVLQLASGGGSLGCRGRRNGEISKLSTALVTAPALLGIGLGIAALQAPEEDPVSSP
jgi:hypothetical protein